jgi:hypothetical protein
VNSNFGQQRKTPSTILAQCLTQQGGLNMDSEMVGRWLTLAANPRVWCHKEKARRGMRNAVLAWVVSLGALITAIYTRQILLT